MNLKTFRELDASSLKELREIAKEMNIRGRSKAKKKSDLFELVSKETRRANASKVGEELVKDRDFEMLCPSYENIKGLTCEDIEKVASEYPKRPPKGGEMSRKEFREYLRHLKVLNRDETYELMKNLRADMFNAYPDLPYDTYVTTPTGGHEMLSIYSYANRLSKNQIPSDVMLDPATGISDGRAWYPGEERMIKSVIVVNDMFRDREMKEVIENVKKRMGSNVNIYAVTIGRDNSLKPKQIPEFSAFRVLGKKEFLKKLRNGTLKRDEVSGISFEHYGKDEMLNKIFGVEERNDREKGKLAKTVEPKKRKAVKRKKTARGEYAEALVEGIKEGFEEEVKKKKLQGKELEKAMELEKSIKEAEKFWEGFGE